MTERSETREEFLYRRLTETQKLLKNTKELRREIVGLRRKLRHAKNLEKVRVYGIKRLLARIDEIREEKAALERESRKGKDQRDRYIMAGFVMTPMDNKDDALVCGVCDPPVVETVPKGDTLLGAYFVARAHWEKFHKEEKA